MTSVVVFCIVLYWSALHTATHKTPMWHTNQSTTAIYTVLCLWCLREVAELLEGDDSKGKTCEILKAYNIICLLVFKNHTWTMNKTNIM